MATWASPVTFPHRCDASAQLGLAVVHPQVDRPVGPALRTKRIKAGRLGLSGPEAPAWASPIAPLTGTWPLPSPGSARRWPPPCDAHADDQHILRPKGIAPRGLASAHSASPPHFRHVLAVELFVRSFNNSIACAGPHAGSCRCSRMTWSTPPRVFSGIRFASTRRPPSGRSAPGPRRTGCAPVGFSLVVLRRSASQSRRCRVVQQLSDCCRQPAAPRLLSARLWRQNLTKAGKELDLARTSIRTF